MSYQAIPPDSDLLKNIVRCAPEEDFVKGFATAQSSDFVPEAVKPRRDYDASDNHELYFGRRWDMLHYLLSEIRRDPQQPMDESDLIHRAIHGGDILGEMVLPQGIPVRYLMPREVKEIADRLERIEADSLDEHWDSSRMRELGVYKIRGEASDIMQLIYLQEDFEKLKDFYLCAAKYGEAVLVFCD